MSRRARKKPADRPPYSTLGLLLRLQLGRLAKLEWVDVRRANVVVLVAEALKQERGVALVETGRLALAMIQPLGWLLAGLFFGLPLVGGSIPKGLCPLDRSSPHNYGVQ